MDGQYKPGNIILGNWTLTRILGEGSFGRVFEAEREDFGRIYKTAVKIITIPQSQSEIMSIMADGMDKNSVTAYFKGFVEELVNEFSLMSSLKGNSNIVSYEDHTVTKHINSIGWDIIIRMELLTPLLIHTQNNTLTKKDVIQLGIDMCKALELCQKVNIIHRDIKPENIFISDMGDFKLGDFGIARTVEKTTSGLSKKGTYTYMAPEIYRGDAYGSSVDIYSLGIVLYRLLNENRNPFMPGYPAPITHSDREKALVKRISGAALPMPKNADGRLAEIVLKACAYDPKERYSSPMQMREELEAIQYSKEEAPVIYPQGDATPQKSVDYVNESPPLEKGHETVGLFSGRKCTNCGFDIESIAIFCNKCGVKQEDTGTPPVIAASTPQSPDDPEKTESMFNTPAAGHETGNSFQFQAQASQPPENQPFNSRSLEIEKNHPSRDLSINQQYPAHSIAEPYPQAGSTPQPPVPVKKTGKRNIIIAAIVAACVVITIILVFLLQGTDVNGPSLSEDPYKVIDRTTDDISLLFESIKEETKAAAVSQASNRNIVEAVSALDTQRILNILDETIKRSEIDYFVVTDNEGTVLARTLDPGYFGDSLFNSPLVQEALSGNTSTSYITGGLSGYSIRAGAPVYDQAGVIIGTMSAGIHIGTNEFVDDLKEKYEMEFTIFYMGDTMRATTFKENGQRMTNITLDSDISYMVFNEKQVYTERITINGEDYIARYLPLIGDSGNAAGIISFYLKTDGRRLRPDEIASEVPTGETNSDNKPDQSTLFSLLTDEEREFIRDSLYIPIAVISYPNPLTYYDFANDMWAGIAIDLLAEIEQLTGLSFVIANDRNVQVSELLQMLENGEVVMITGLVQTEESLMQNLWVGEYFMLNNREQILASILAKAVYLIDK